MARTRFLFSNFASSVLTADIDEFDVLLPLRAGDGARFPNPDSAPASGPVTSFMVGIEAADGFSEICQCTSRSSDTLTVARGQENTEATPFSAGARVECRVTAGVLSEMMQMHDPISHEAITALSGINTPWVRNLNNEGHTSIQLLPGVKPFVGTDQVNGEIQSLADLPIGVIVIWHGPVSTIPERWHLCDGTNGTEDMRDLFILGAGGAFAVNASRRSRGTVTSSVPPHAHGGSTVGAILTLANLPDVPLRAPSGRTLTGQSVGYRSDGNQNNLGAMDVPLGGSGVAHAHVINDHPGFPGGINIPDVTPAYYAKCFIQRIA